MTAPDTTQEPLRRRSVGAIAKDFVFAVWTSVLVLLALASGILGSLLAIVAGVSFVTDRNSPPSETNGTIPSTAFIGTSALCLLGIAGVSLLVLHFVDTKPRLAGGGAAVALFGSAAVIALWGGGLNLGRLVFSPLAWPVLMMMAASLVVMVRAPNPEGGPAFKRRPKRREVMAKAANTKEPGDDSESGAQEPAE